MMVTTKRCSIKELIQTQLEKDVNSLANFDYVNSSEA